MIKNEKLYKLSRYNVIFTRDGMDYLWNTLTNAFLKLDPEGKAYIESFSGEADDSDYFKILRNNGCIVNADFNELGKVLTDEKAVMLNPNPKNVHYTIAPGLGCNYKCVYCFEKNRAFFNSMSEDTCEAVVDFILKHAEENKNLEHIGITWFGGEPLMYLDIIEKLSSRLMNYCDARGILYNAGIVTNGRYLTPENANRLKSVRVKYVQLSMDGMKEYYTAQKQAGEKDFDEVVKNIQLSADIIPITVRINVADNYPDALQLTDYLLKEKKLDGKIKIYIAHVRDYGDQNMCRVQSGHESFMNTQKEYMGMFGNGEKYSHESFAEINPLRKCTTCLSVCAPNFCIGPNGELYRCEHFLGLKDKIVGDVFSGRFYTEAETKYLTFTHLDKCLRCSIFPICMGGCMNDVTKDDNAIACDRFIEQMVDMKMFAISTE